MTSQPKPRRKRTLEPLDWRELAEGPALRGLTEILSTPPDIARERASKRAEVEAQPASAGAASSDGASSLTVGVSPTVVLTAEPEHIAIHLRTEEVRFPSLIDPARSRSQMVSESPQEELVTPTVVETPTGGDLGMESPLPGRVRAGSTYDSRLSEVALREVAVGTPTVGVYLSAYLETRQIASLPGSSHHQ